MSNVAINIVISIFFVVFLVWIGYLQNKLTKIEKQLKGFCSGKDGESLEEIITICGKGVKENQNSIKQLFDKCKDNNDIALNGIQKVSVIRFNPFKDVGGDQSFVAAFLNAHGDGALISSLTSRDGTRVYAKPIIRGESEYRMTDEEQKVIKNAME